MDGDEVNFDVLSSFLVHQTTFTTVTLQLINIQNSLYVGLLRLNYCPTDRNEPPRKKGIFLPLEAFERLLEVTLPKLRISIQLQKESEKFANQAQRDYAKFVKREQQNGIFLGDIFFFHQIS